MAIISRVFPVTPILTLLSAFALTVAGSAQQQPASTPPPQQDSAETFKVDVGVVNVFFNVKDKHGMLIPGLKKEEFEVKEDGQPQTIKYFAAESNLPLTLGILIDTSGSQQRVLP